MFISGNHIIVGGEATTTLSLTPVSIDHYIREVLVDIGYNSFLRSKGFTDNHVYITHDYKIESYVSSQSPDIANGVGINKGFNDNGIFFGYACGGQGSKTRLCSSRVDCSLNQEERTVMSFIESHVL